MAKNVHIDNRGYKKLSLKLAIDDRGHRRIYVGSDEMPLYLKSFCGKFDYDKFITESVLLHLFADKKTLDKVRRKYNRLSDCLDDYYKQQVDYEL